MGDTLQVRASMLELLVFRLETVTANGRAGP